MTRAAEGTIVPELDRQEPPTGSARRASSSHVIGPTWTFSEGGPASFIILC